MFTERAALKIRLEQLVDSEERILREFRSEREVIFGRLRELDATESHVQEGQPASSFIKEPVTTLSQRTLAPSVEVTPFPTEESISELPNMTPVGEEEQQAPAKPKRKYTKRKKSAQVRQGTKTRDLRQAVIDILQEENREMRGAELRRAAEDRTGWEIANMTAFMNLLNKKYPQLQKLGRGTYGWQNIDGVEVASVEEEEEE